MGPFQSNSVRFGQILASLGMLGGVGAGSGRGGSATGKRISLDFADERHKITSSTLVFHFRDLGTTLRKKKSRSEKDIHKEGKSAINLSNLGTFARFPDVRADGPKSPEIRQKGGVSGSEIAAPNRKSLATFHRTLKSQCSTSSSCLGNH